MTKKDTFTVYVRNKPISKINEELFKKQKLNKIDLCKLKHHYIILHSLFEKAENTDSVEELIAISEQVKHTEYMLQEIWKFKLDKNLHRYWFMIPKCDCPKIDNRERLGTGHFIISDNCPIHGNKL